MSVKCLPQGDDGLSAIPRSHTNSWTQERQYLQLLQRTQVCPQPPTWRLTTVTPVSKGNLMPPSGHHGYCMHMVYLHIGKTGMKNEDMVSSQIWLREGFYHRYRENRHVEGLRLNRAMRGERGGESERGRGERKEEWVKRGARNGWN